MQLDWQEVLNNGLKSGSKSGEYYAPYCPFPDCGKPGGFYFNTKKRTYICFKCGRKGRIGFLEEQRAISTHEMSLSGEGIRGLINSKFNKEKEEVYFHSLEEISEPLNPRNYLANTYIYRDRRFTKKEVERFNIRIGKRYYDQNKGYDTAKFLGRILFPFFEKRKFVYAVGRSYVESDIKYLNTEGSKNRVVYGLDNVQGDTCQLCEGIISGIKAERVTGIPFIATLGKSLSETQLDKIAERGIRKVFLAYDGDVDKFTINGIHRQLLSRNIKVMVVRLPYKTDPDDLGLKYLRYFKRAEPIFI